MVNNKVLVFLILCLVAVTWATIPNGNINIKIVNDLDQTIDRLRQTEQFLTQEKAKNLGNIAPYVLHAKTLASSLAVDIREGLDAIGAALTGTNYIITENDIRNIQSAASTITDNIGTFVDTLTVQNVHNHLSTLIKQIDDAHAIYRQFPLIAVRSLLSIASFTAVFHPIMEIVAPQLAQKSFLPCKLKDALLSYRPLVVHARLETISVNYPQPGNAPSAVLTNSIKNIMVDIIRKPYSEYGYAETRLNAVRCDTNSDTTSAPRVFLDDRGNTYVAGLMGSLSWSYCFHDYMALVRYRTEQPFDSAINLLRLIPCAPNYETGNGWMIINIQRFISRGVGDEAIYCDTNSPCDPYVKIFENNAMVYQTAWLDDTSNAVFMETYTTEKIKKTDKIRLEVWDYDNWQGGNHDLMLSAEMTGFHPKASIQNTEGNLLLETNVVWKPERYD